jgi:hypothetical protein
MLLFWLPVCFGILSFFYFAKRSRKTIILILSFCPTAFFIAKIISHTFYQSSVDVGFLHYRIIFIGYPLYFCSAVFL